MLRILTLLTSLLMATGLSASTLTGTIYDADDSQPVGFATVRVIGSGQSVSSNETGMYRLKLEPGTYGLKFSHVAHYSETIEVTVTDSSATVDVYLRPAVIEVGSIKVYDRQYDAAQRIIIEAIARKEQLLSQIKEYSFEAYTKLIARDTSKADSSSVIAIFESQLDAFWKYPDQFKEIITGRRQTANIPAQDNLLQVGQLTDFNANRIDFGRYAVVSPTATDALDHYEYYLIDTIFVDSNAIFVLEIEPKNQTDPLFEGTIRIADSSYAVVGVDLTPNKGFDNPYLSKVHYRQIYALFENEYWMPTMIQLTAILNLKLPIIPVLSIDYQAALHDYQFSLDSYEPRFDEYALEVDKAADDIDSLKWDNSRLIPLTKIEERGYVYVDSMKNHQPLLKKLCLVPLGITAVVLAAPDFFHFNRVEGPYLGVGHKFEKIRDRLDVRIKSGYAFDADIWQHEYGFDFTISDPQKFTIGAEYRDEIRTRPTIFARPNGNATFMAAMSKTDAYDYYLEKGFLLRTGTKLLPKTRVNFTYRDFDQSSIPNNSEFSVFNPSDSNRVNPAIVDGKLRSLTATFTFDSRQLFRDKGRDRPMFSFPSTQFKIGVEHASDDVFDNDFDFTRYWFSLERMQRLFGWAVGNLYVYGGASDGTLPPQRYFVADFDAGLAENRLTFKTMAQENFAGSRVFAAYTSVDFGRKLFQKSGLPLVKKIPLGLILYGGAFWADFDNHPYQTGDEFLLNAPRPYGEAGFGVGGLLPLSMVLNFTWQLSQYDTSKFNFGFSTLFF